MQFSTLVKHVIELTRIIYNSHKAPDALASEYLRSKKYIGSNDRKVISEMVFSCLRIHPLAAYAVQNYLKKCEIHPDVAQIPIIKAAAGMVLSSFLVPGYVHSLTLNLSKMGYDYEGINPLLAGLFNDFNVTMIEPEDFSTSILEFANKVLATADSGELYPNEVLCFTDTIVNSLKSKHKPEFINNLALECMQSAPLCLRVNTLVMSREKAIKELALNGITAVPSKLSPAGLIIKERVNLSNLDIFNNGSIEVQDIGSQLISYSLAPEENSRILDACAGAGGKTIHLGVLTNDKADIIATDTEYHRLKEIDTRAKRAGLYSIKSVLVKPSQLKELVRKRFDYILIDAPCSGMGTVRRLPMQKHRLSDKLLKRISKNQYQILEYYSQFLTEGGTLVYATCSFLPDENEKVVERFLENHPEFSPVPLSESFSKYDINIPDMNEEDYHLTLTPLNHESDGFFMAKLRKTQ